MWAPFRTFYVNQQEAGVVALIKCLDTYPGMTRHQRFYRPIPHIASELGEAYDRRKAVDLIHAVGVLAAVHSPNDQAAHRVCESRKRLRKHLPDGFVSALGRRSPLLEVELERLVPPYERANRRGAAFKQVFEELCQAATPW